MKITIKMLLLLGKVGLLGLGLILPKIRYIFFGFFIFKTILIYFLKPNPLFGFFFLWV